MTADLSDLPSLEYSARLPRLRAAMAAAELPALLVSRLVNVRYLTGFTGSAGTLLVSADDALLVTDGRYTTQSREQIEAAGVPVRIEVRTQPAEQAQVSADFVSNFERAGLEEHGVTWAQQRAYAQQWPVELVPAGMLVEGLRRRKDPGEVARIRAACAIADDAFASVVATLPDGPTEREFALALEFAMRSRGASAMSFDPIVASGPNAAKPHARPSDRPIGRHELVIFDFGCIVDGYCSDMTRTVSVGEPPAEARALYELVLRSQQAGRDAVKAGVSCRALDAVCRDIIVEGGLGDRFSHGTGHGVGIEIHEAPRVAMSAGDAVLLSGDVVTVEPGVYLEGVGGVRIEDTVVVSDTGAEALTRTPKTMVL